MRIGSYNSTVRYRNSINRTYEDQTKLFEQSDGSRLHRPSDDCVGYSKYLRHTVTYQENNQYQTNVQTAISWMKNTDSVLVDMANAFSKVVVKSNQADGANSDTDMKAIAGEMLVQVQQAVADANANVNGRYLFSGQSDLVQPYEISKEQISRGLAKTLDDKQMEYFYDVNRNGDVAQMLTMYGDDGNTYYLNTATGNVYSWEFVEEGFQTKVAQGQIYVKHTEHDPDDPTIVVQSGDEVGNLSQWHESTDVANYFEATGEITANGKSFSDTVTVGGKAVTVRFATVEQYIVTYKGDRKQFSMVKENGAVQPSSDTVNASGIEIAGRGIFDDEASGNGRINGKYIGPSGTNAFNDMLTVVAMCDHGLDDWDYSDPTSPQWVGYKGPNSSWMSEEGKTLANNAYNTVNAAQTKIASRQAVYRDCQAMLTTQNVQVLGDITDVHSTDVSKLAVDMMASQTVYNLSLNVGARILPQTLTDYLH